MSNLAEYTCTLCGYHAAFDGSETQIQCGGCGKTICLFKVGLDVASGPDKTVSVAVETGDNADRSLKAYWVQVIDDEWGMWIHAESAGKAKKIYLDQDPSITHADFVAIRATRPAQGADLLDCTPFTDHTLHLAGYFWDEVAGFKDTFLEFCPCSMCKAERLKPTYRMTIKQMVEA